MLEDERSSLAKVPARHPGYCFPGMSPEESERETLMLIDHELDELAACDSLLSRTEAG